MWAGGGDSSGEEGGLQIDVEKGGGGKPKTSSAVGKVTKNETRKWNPGDIVWAKVSGFNYWPAKVFDASDSTSVPKWLSEPPKPNYSLVRFFGSYDMQWVSQRLIEGYEKGCKKKFQNKCRSKLFQKSVKEVKEYVEKGTVPEGLTLSVEDPDTHSTDEEKEDDKVGVASANDEGPPPKENEIKKVKPVETKAPPSTSAQPHQEVAPQSTNGSRSRRRKGSPRRLSSSSIDNEDTSPAKRAKLDEEKTADSMVIGEKKGKDDRIKPFTSAPLPLSKKSSRTRAVES